MTRQRLNSVLIYISVLGACLSPISHAKEIDWNWKTECIGRYQLSVPGESEYPIATYKQLFEKNPDYKFIDGSSAYFQNINYEGVLKIGDGTSREDFEATKEIASQRMQDLKKYLIQRSDNSAAEQTVKIPLQVDDAFAWRVEAAIKLYLLRNKFIFNWAQSGEPQEFEPNLIKMQDFISAFRSRSIFEIPKTNGVCVPFAYLEDNGKKSRDVAVSLRSKIHPDVIISFRDNDSILNGSDINSKQGVTAALLDYHEDSSRKNIEGIHSQTIDGREGAAGFFHLNRKNGKKDFLYLAVVRGTNDEIPSLVIRIERVAESAKDHPPITESEFKLLVDHVLRSVHKRLVVQ